jgi:hypothetical protein
VPDGVVEVIMTSFPKPKPHLFDKIADRQDAERTRRAAYAIVAIRDQRTCRCCGRKGSYDAGGVDGLHRHHLTYRSRGGEDTTANLVTLCARCHVLEHVARQLHIVGTDADQRLEFEIDEAAVVEIFGTRPLPAHVRITARSRR